MSWRNLLTPQIERYFAPQQENSFSSQVTPMTITPTKSSASIYESKRPKPTYEEVEPDQEFSQENSPELERSSRNTRVDPQSSGSDFKKNNRYYFSKKTQNAKKSRTTAHSSIAFDSSSISSSSRYQEKLQGIKKEMSFLKEQLNKYPGTRRSNNSTIRSSQNMKSQTLGAGELKKNLEVSKRSSNEIVIQDNESSDKRRKRKKKADNTFNEGCEEINNNNNYNLNANKANNIRHSKENLKLVQHANKTTVSSDLSSFICRSGYKDSSGEAKKSSTNLTPLQPLASEANHKKGFEIDDHFGQNLDKVFLAMEDATTIQKNKRSRSKNPSWLSIHDIHDYEIVDREVTRETVEDSNKHFK